MNDSPDREDDAQKFAMTVDLNVLDHLGINLYSNIAAVITEVVANAWDADARDVTIEFGPGSEWIEIKDDGIGMSIADLNDKYLRVGYRRRDSDGEFGRVTAKGRPVMGRKGLGKLSLFSIANSIEVQSCKDGASSGFRMSVAGIHRAVEARSAYHPDGKAGSVISAVYKTPSTIELNFLRASRDLATYARLRKLRDRQLGLFVMTPQRDAMAPLELDRVDNILGEQSWNLEQQGFVVSAHDSAALLARDVWHWAEVSA